MVESVGRSQVLPRLSQSSENALTGLPVRLIKMGPRDDPEAFLVTFEQVAMVALWPPEHWATLLTPDLTRPAQTAYQNLNPTEGLHYAKVKAAI